MNSFTLTAVGQLARNPELVARGDTAYARFCLVGNDYAGKDEEGAAREVVTAMWFVAFGALGETIATNSRKGDQLFVEARVRANNWTDKQGEKQYAHSFVVQGFRFGAPGKAKREERDTRRDDGHGFRRMDERGNGRDRSTGNGAYMGVGAGEVTPTAARRSATADSGMVTLSGVTSTKGDAGREPVSVEEDADENRGAVTDDGTDSGAITTPNDPEAGVDDGVGEEDANADKSDARNKEASADNTAVPDDRAGADKGSVLDEGASADKGSAPDEGASADKGPAPDEGASADKGPAPDEGVSADKGSAPDESASAEKDSARDESEDADKGSVPSTRGARKRNTRHGANTSAPATTSRNSHKSGGARSSRRVSASAA